MRIYLIFITFLISLESIAQVHDFDNIMQKNTVQDCRSISLNCLQLIPEYYKSDKVDSALLLIDYWEFKCGVNEYSNRAKVLLSMASEHDTDLRTLSVDELLTYGGKEVKTNHLAPKPYGYYYYNFGYNYYNENNSLFQEFNQFTLDLANTLWAEKELKPIDSLIVDFYRGNFEPLWRALKENKLEGNTIQDQYNDVIEYTLKKSFHLNTSLIVGTWIPGGNASKLGIHPEFGFQMGAKRNRLMLDLTMILKFLKTSNTYQVFYQDSLFDTNDFLGGYIGGELGFVLARSNKIELQALSGVAFDGYDALEFDENSDYSNVSINSLNLNLGLGFRYYYSASNYISIRGRYNFVNYKNNGGTNLSGNTVSIRFLWGFCGNQFKTYVLPRMYYFD